MMSCAQFMFYRKKQNEKTLLLRYTFDKTVWQLPAVFSVGLFNALLKTFY